MAEKIRNKKWSQYFMVLIFALVLVPFNYLSGLPKQYAYKVGDIAREDIVLLQPIEDKGKTKQKSDELAAAVTPIMLRSDSISNESLNDIKAFFDAVEIDRALLEDKYLGEKTERAIMTTERKDEYWNVGEDEARSSSMKTQTFLLEQQKKDINLELITKVVGLVPSVYTSFKEFTIAQAEVILRDKVDRDYLQTQYQHLTNRIQGEVENYKEEMMGTIDILKIYLRPNLVADEVATQKKRDMLKESILSDPVMLSKGSRIVNKGDQITDEVFALLKSGNLIKDGGLNYNLLIGITIITIALSLIFILYLSYSEVVVTLRFTEKLTIGITLLIPFLASFYISSIFPTAPPVYFAAILLTVYFNKQFSFVSSVLLTLLIFPMTYLNHKFIFCAILGCMVAILITANFSKRDKYAFLIMSTGFIPFISGFAIDLIQKTELRLTWMENIAMLLSGIVSSVLAIGVMPLYEMFLDAVSPMRLLELSQPNQPLLKKLFIEAPATSQHSIMVANLAEAGAEAMGANALLCRLGAMYHDIGKLSNPSMYTENQNAENPHDYLKPEESARIIKKHVQMGVKYAKEFSLPRPIIDCIQQHHGTQIIAVFYTKALKQSEIDGTPAPNMADFCYDGPKPQNKENGIVMLADSVEAAMKSTGLKDLDEIEKLIRRVIHIKNEQAQLNDTGLTTSDIEKIIKAFLIVFRGQLHERVKYPGDSQIYKNQNK